MRPFPVSAALGTLVMVFLIACSPRESAPDSSRSSAATPSSMPGSTVSPSGPVDAPRSVNRPPEFRREVRTNTYRVTGATPAAIQQQIAARGPGQWAGLTSYAITYGFTARQVGPRCFAKDIYVKVTSDIEVPAWNHPTAAGASTVAYWRSLDRGLRRHEKQHVVIAERTGRDVMHALAHLPGVDDCNDLDRIVDARAHRQLQIGKRAQKAYDDRTNHGVG